MVHVVEQKKIETKKSSPAFSRAEPHVGLFSHTYPDASPRELDQILMSKLEKAFHEQTSRFAVQDIAQIASEHSAIDLAYAASCLPPNLRPVIYKNLASLEDKEKFLLSAQSSTRLAVLRNIADQEISQLVQMMAADDAVFLLENLSERRYRRILELLPSKKTLQIREIKKHQKNTAGRLMTSEFFAFPLHWHIKEAIAYIKAHPGIEFTAQIFVIDAKGLLQGYIPSRNLIVNQPHLRLFQIMRPVSHVVSAETYRDEVVDLVERYRMPALPVVDEEEKLLGVITQEDVLEAMEDRADATMAQVGGTKESVGGEESHWKRVGARMPWLVVTLLAGLINVGLMSSLDHYTQGVMTFVLFFVPLITGMSGNIGIQCSTVLVRSLATGHLLVSRSREALLKEAAIGISMGLAFGIACGFIVWLFQMLGYTQSNMPPSVVGLFVGAGLSGACLTGTLLGVCSPLLFARLGVDPAIASGPIVAALNDFFSMAIYFLITMGLCHLLSL